jgi:uroporphyrinogen decarboxylase
MMATYQMNSRERILGSIAHKEPDKVPIDLGSSTVTGISAIALNNLKSVLGIESPTRVFDVVQQLAKVDMEIIDNFNVDAIDLNRIFMDELDWYPVTLGNGSQGEYPEWFRPERDEDGSLFVRDKKGAVMSRMAKNGNGFNQVLYPWEKSYPENFNDISEALKSINWTAHSHTKFISIPDDELRSRTRKVRESTDRAIIMSGGAKFLELAFFLRRMDNLLMDLLADQDNLSKLLDKLMELHLAGLEKKIHAVGDLVDIIRFGDDLGMTKGPFMDKNLFRKLFKPRYKEICDYVKQNSEMKIFFHSCGSIREFIPDLIEAGFDILNPIQTNCEGMDPLELKNEFGNDITFWGGGVDNNTILPSGSPAEVRSDVLRRCEIFSRNGGFVFAPIHNILQEVPPENILAAYNAVNEFNGNKV